MTKGIHVKPRLYKYGLESKEYKQLLIEQAGRCKICKRAGGRKLVIDHSHETGKVRGLLCQSCNTALGKFQDSPFILLAAIHYLNSTNRLDEKRADKQAKLEKTLEDFLREENKSLD